ncbi:hypothetical protein E2C01_007527 [Portunus trituberculatus]|uniref:Uncharacterized protein n=1 Tax=Portunus trituberculatus TaxID=210409 RepID=A0A5B7D1E5_PORTR|nr:hypothetical protein [Portunus trituberculatus]
MCFNLTWIRFPYVVFQNFSNINKVLIQAKSLHIHRECPNNCRDLGGTLPVVLLLHTKRFVSQGGVAHHLHLGIEAVRIQVNDDPAVISREQHPRIPRHREIFKVSSLDQQFTLFVG